MQNSGSAIITVHGLAYRTKSLSGGKSEFWVIMLKSPGCSRAPSKNVRPRASKTVLGTRATLYVPWTVLEALGRTFFPGSLEHPGDFVP